MVVGDRDYKQIVRDAIDSIGEDAQLKFDLKDSIQFTSTKQQNVYVVPSMIERSHSRLNRHNSTKFWVDYSEK